MEDEEILLFEFEVERQTRIALLALQRASEISLRGNDRELDAAGLQRGADLHSLYLSAFVIAAGNVSKLLFLPRDSKLKARGEILRAIFGVEPNSPLADRTLRNKFEHHEAELEKYIQSHNIQRDRPYGLGREFHEGFQGLDNAQRVELVAKYGDHEFNLMPMIRELQRILESHKGPVGNRIYLIRPELRRPQRG